MGHAPWAVHLVGDEDEASRVEVADPERVAYLTQTTLSVDETAGVIGTLRERFPVLAGPRSDDICYATQNRQAAVKTLARDCQLVLVIGAMNSSNSVRLVEVARAAGCRAHLVSEAAAVDPAWFEGVDTVGISSGASALEWLVDELVEALRAGRDRGPRGRGGPRGRPLRSPGERCAATPRRSGPGGPGGPGPGWSPGRSGGPAARWPGGTAASTSSVPGWLASLGPPPPRKGASATALEAPTGSAAGSAPTGSTTSCSTAGSRSC